MLHGEKNIFSARTLHVSTFAQVTLSTQRHVRIVSANEYLFVSDTMLPVREESGGPICTLLAKSSNPFHSVCQRNTVQDFSKLPAIGVSIQSNEIQISFVRVHCILHKRNQIMEKLCFIHKNHLILQKFIQRNIVQIVNAQTRDCISIVGHNCAIGAIPSILGMLDNKNRSPHRRITRYNGKNTRTLSGKHGTNENIKGHFAYRNHAR